MKKAAEGIAPANNLHNRCIESSNWSGISVEKGRTQSYFEEKGQA